MKQELLHFIHTHEFETSVAALLSERDVQAMQQRIVDDPEAGDVIAGTGGIRKLRVAASGRGKRGGARVIYYYQSAKGHVFLLLAYAKNEADDLSEDGKKYLRRLVQQMKEEA